MGKAIGARLDAPPGLSGLQVEADEVQATAEGTPFSDEEFTAMLGLARKGIADLVNMQKLAIS